MFKPQNKTCTEQGYFCTNLLNSTRYAYLSKTSLRKYANNENVI